MVIAICPNCGREFSVVYEAVSEQHRDYQGRYYLNDGCSEYNDDTEVIQ